MSDEMRPNYLRARDGKTFHRAGCSRAKGAVPWSFAAGMDADTLTRVTAEFPWLIPCKVCRPLSAAVSP